MTSVSSEAARRKAPRRILDEQAIVARATDAIPTLARVAGLTERQGRLSQESLATARGLGGFALATPARHGGSEVAAETMAQALVQLGRGCPSTAWVAGVVATAKTMAGAVMGEQALEEAFADPDGVMCGSGSPRGRGTPERGGISLSGRWAYLSGCEDASWALLGAMVDAGGGEPPAFSLAVVPVAELSFERTWHVAGMRGTGSNTLVADAVFVPAHRVAAMSPPAAADALYYAVTALAPCVGAARGALDVVAAMFEPARESSTPGPSRIAESPEARHWLIEATQLIDDATRRTLDVCRIIDASRAAAAPAPMEQARCKLELTLAAGECRRAVDKLLDLHGSSGFFEANPLQRFWRDLAVGSRHLLLNPYLAMEEYGRLLTVR